MRLMRRQDAALRMLAGMGCPELVGHTLQRRPQERLLT